MGEIAAAVFRRNSGDVRARRESAEIMIRPPNLFRRSGDQVTQLFSGPFLDELEVLSGGRVAL